MRERITLKLEDVNSMDELLKEMESCYSSLRKVDNVQKLYRYFKDKKFLALFFKQYKCLLSNLKSIDILVGANAVEDAFTIFRKYLETYFNIMCLINHPDLVPTYMKHNKYVSDKVVGNNKNEIKEIRANHPDGYIEYGYIEKYIEEDGIERYTIRMLAKVAGVEQFYEYYKKCNNFVHNNLVSIKVNDSQANEALNKQVMNTTNLLLDRINGIIGGN